MDDKNKTAAKTIRVNGVTRTATNWYSSGPGTEVHTYDLKGGRAYVRNYGAGWVLHRDGDFPRKVTVDV